MILVIPFLKLENGRNLLVIKGKEGTESYYKQLSNDPIEFCKLIRTENFKTIHIDIVDSIVNNLIVLKGIAKSLDIPIQVKAEFESLNQCRQLLDNGIYRIIVNDLAIARRVEIKELIKEYTPSRVVCYVNSNRQSISLIEYLRDIKQIGFQRIVYQVNGMEINSINLDKFKEILKTFEMRITLFDGVSSANQLWELEELMPFGVDSVIIGEPFYQNNFPCQMMWREIEGKLKSSF